MSRLTTLHHQNCSASASPSSSSCEVFIHYYSIDVEYTFVRELCYDLLYRGLRAFPMLMFHAYSSCMPFRYPRPSRETAIHDACVHVAIFSPNYAQSKWCLNELVIIANSGVTILPVFYQVNPSDLRWTGEDKQGGYADALRKHKQNEQTIQNWRDALNRVAGVSGFEVDVWNRGHAEIWDKVFQSLLKAVPKTRLDAAKYETGLGQKIEEFEKLLRSQHKGRVEAANIVGIVGVSGVGKTTLANAFLNLKSSDYDGTSFLYDVKESAERMCLNSLQAQLMKDLKHIDHDIKIWECEEGVGILKKNLWSCRALIVLDDVDHLDQLHAFLPIKSVLHPRSLILVTSRHKDVLINAGIADSSIYHLMGLNREDSQELFCWHAFFHPHPRPGFVSAVDGVLRACDGLLLLLKAFGAFIWRGPEISDGAEIQVSSLLEALPREEREMFLDIAHFFIGKDRDAAIRIWNRSAWPAVWGFRTLQAWCLVEVDGENKIRMHDKLRESARYIKNSQLRLTSGATDPGLTSATLPLRSIRGMPHAWKDVRPMLGKKWSSLSLVETEGYHAEQILRGNSVSWLRWNECPYFFLPSWLELRHLRVLEVTGTELEGLWGNEGPAPIQLRELKIRTPKLLHFPKGFYDLKHLEKIVVNVPKMTDEDYDVFINHRGPDAK